MSIAALSPKRLVSMLKETASSWMEDNALRLSAALAYYSIFSIAPLLVISIGLAGLIFGGDAVRGHLDTQLEGYLGPKAAEVVQSMVQGASNRGGGIMATVTGFVMLFIGASGVFGQLKDALNCVWEVKRKPGGGIGQFIRERLASFSMVLVIGFLLLTSLVLTTVIAAFTGYLGNSMALGGFLANVLSFAVSMGVVSLLFAFIFKVLPDAEVQWSNVWVGAVATALLFEMGKFGLSYYLGRESTSSPFGAAGAVVLLLLWVYYTSCILLFGAEFTQVYAKATGHVITPSANAVSVTADERAQQGLVPAPARESLVPLIVSEPEEKPALPEKSPFGLLFAVSGSAFLLSLIARRRVEHRKQPDDQIRSGMSDLSEEAAARIGDWVTRSRRRLS
jgi:membrane protein